MSEGHGHSHDHNPGHSRHQHDEHAHEKHAHEHAHSHSHGHVGHSHHHFQGEAPQVIFRAILVTVVFMAIELIGGWYANSLALVSDGAHMLTDVGAMLLSLFALWVARRPSTPTMSFGYHRAEILGALVSGLMIWLISGVLVYEAILRMSSPPEVEGPIVFVVATIGLIANLLSMWMLNKARHHNMNVRAAYLHLLSDSLGSLGAIIAGAILWFTDWKIVDPIVTIFFAILMLFSSWSLIKEAVGVLMESTPNHIDPKQITKDLLAIPQVEEAHDLHIWTVSSGRLALSVHLISPSSEVLLAANELLEKKYEIRHTTIQVEHPKTFKSERCYDCMPLELNPGK